VQIHLLIALPSRVVLHEAAAAPLDLHTASRLLLDMLDVAASCANDLRAQVETRDRFEVDGDLLLRPLTTTERVAFHLRLFSATEAALVDEVGQFLFHEFIDLLDCFFQTILGGARDVEVERRVLQYVSAPPI